MAHPDPPSNQSENCRLKISSNQIAEAAPRIIQGPESWVGQAQAIAPKIRSATSREELLGLLGQLPYGSGLEYLISRAISLGFIQPDKDLDGLARISTAKRAKLIWECIKDLKLLDWVKLVAGDELEVYALGSHNLLFEAKPILQELAKRLGDFIVSKEVLSELLIYVSSDAKPIARAQINPARYLLLQNGILNLESLELVDSPEAYFSYQLPLELDPGFIQELKQGKIQDGYFQQNPLVSCIRQFYDDENWEKLKLGLGSILAPIPLKLIVAIIGPTNTGKTTLAEALKSCLDKLVANIPLSDLDRDQFALESLETARVIISTERTDLAFRSTELLKRLVGGDTLSINRKHKSRINVENILKLFSFANKLPRFNQIDDALAERFLIIFTQNPLAQPDPNLIKQLKQQRKEVFEFLVYCAWLLKQEGYRIQRDVQEVIELLEEASFPLSEWISQRCREDQQAMVRREDAYNDYVEWAKSGKSERVLTRRKFYELLRTRYAEVVRRGEYYFRGITLAKSDSGWKLGAQ